MQHNLKNIGPVSWRALERVGIKDVSSLRRVGAVGAYILVAEDQGSVSLNLLYALAAGLSDRHWRDVGAEEKGRLNREVEDLRESHSHGAG